jgi:hypothetical protein
MIYQVYAFCIISLLAFALESGPLQADESQANAQSVAEAREARLGIGVTPLPEVLKSHLSDVIGDGRGILVSEVFDGSPAKKAGIKKHDVLVRYGNQDLYSPEQLVKRVRNDAPGNTVELQFVRAGKQQTTTVELDQQAKKEPVFSQWNWPGFASRFNVPWSPLRPEYWTEAQDAEGDGTEWTSFESLTVNKNADGVFLVRITYKDTSGNSISKEFKGTRQEIRDAINTDSDLPESRKNQLIRTLDDRGRQPMPRMPWDAPQRELFNWPNVNF